MVGRRTSSDGVVTRRVDPEVVVASLHGSYSPVVLDLRGLPCDVRLRVQFADALEGLTGVNGPWRSVYTAQSNCAYIRDFARWCADNNVHELSELSPNLWNNYLLHRAENGQSGRSQRGYVGVVRQMLRCYPHRLHPDLPRSLNRRLPTMDGDGSQPLDIKVFEAIRGTAMAAVNAEYQRISPNVLLLKNAESERLSPDKQVRAEALREIATTGALQSDAGRRALGFTAGVHKNSGIYQGRPLLFVSYQGAVAIAVLIACLEGVNFTQINERKVPSGAPGLGVAEEILSVEDEKRRRPSDPYDAHAIPKNARRAMMKIVEMTQPARDYVVAHGLPGSDRVIIYWSAKGGRATPQIGLNHKQVSKTKKLPWWPDEDVPLSFNRIRKTVRVLTDRAPQGHSRATWSTHYVRASEGERERLMTDAVETGLWAVILSAENHLKMKFERTNRPTETDTTIGGCIDFERHPLTGEPCGDDFLLCLQCTHAVATPRHLPRLIELRHQLEAIASTDGPDWTDFRAMAYRCLLVLLEDRSLITADEYRIANGSITDEDRAEIHLLLNGKYT